MDKSDPLKTEDHLIALSGVLRDMSQLLARPDLMRDQFAGLSKAQRVARRARTSVRRASAAVDHMLVLQPDFVIT